MNHALLYLVQALLCLSAHCLNANYSASHLNHWRNSSYRFRRQACAPETFQCKSGECIDISLRCDGNRDCEDKSDETEDLCRSSSCSESAFRCSYGACIDGDGRCNGVPQCADASDESPDICECGRQSPPAVPTQAGKPFVSNGVKTKFGEFPWHVAIYQLIDGVEMQICGGTLISSRDIITAAHCFYNDASGKAYPTSQFKVVVGKYFRDWSKRSTYTQEGQIKNIFLHERYRGYVLHYASDIAMINLKKDIQFNPIVRPVCLDKDEKFISLHLSTGVVGAVVGWGINENKQPSQELMTAYLPFVDFSDCYDSVPKNFRPFLTPDKFCAGHRNGTSVCPGDSGGGLVFEEKSEKGSRWYLQGIVSVGVSPTAANECFDTQYAAFIEVANFYDFITEHMTA